MPTTHKLKCLPDYWDAQMRGEKTFEVRVNDRGYAVGDVLELHCLERPDGRKPAPLLRRVTYILPGGTGLGDLVLIDPHAVVMATIPVTVPGQSPDRMMAAHLRTTLLDVRELVDVEHPMSDKVRATAIGMIDEALGEDDDHRGDA